MADEVLEVVEDEVIDTEVVDEQLADDAVADEVTETDGDVAEETSEEAASLAEFLAAQGVEIDGEDDTAILTNLAQRYTETAAKQQEYERRLAEREAQLQNWQNQQAFLQQQQYQQQVAAQQQQQQAVQYQGLLQHWNQVPKIRPELFSIPQEQWTPEMLAEANARRQWEVNATQTLIENFPVAVQQAIAPALQQYVPQVVAQIIAQENAQRQRQSEAERAFAQVAPFMVEKDKDGKTLKTAAGQPRLTPFGQSFQKHFAEIEQQAPGLSPTKMTELATKAAYAELAAAKPNAAKKNVRVDILRKAAQQKPNRNGGNPAQARAVRKEPAESASMNLAQEMAKQALLQ